MKYLMILSALVLFAACSDSPESPSGTLPIVQNCRIMEDECKGDTVVVAWDAVAVEVDGYEIWFAETDPGNWVNIARVEGTTTEHIATSTGYYCVKALKGIDLSEDFSNKANDRAELHLLSDTLTVSGINGIRFEAAQTTIGDATETDFAQDLYIAKSGDTILMYRGNTEPATYPGGSNSLLSTASNYVAPGPGDASWMNSAAVQNGTDYFVQLENGDYAYFVVDTVATDFVVIGSTQYQSITSLRLFNTFLF
ncbi:MAG: hypothetical protein KAS73_14810 [Candidatus Sabulitectum sp.]|nr:hypothetical protein [Candidatus Sabulitectum sp.]